MTPEPLEYLFVYGTLAPGRENAHVLAGVAGEWRPASVRGTLHPEGWGAAFGYPGLVPDPHAGRVRGLVFASAELGAHWQRLDDFEGEGYERLRVDAELDDGTIVRAHVYALRPGTGAPA
ncbi:MAG TPA: gamma-glutamylcyclotransferase family protein [Xanthomonadales bacterium]|nr:gamma-glutamylcyclotransferase family protein [Xanthomonadales bacterium]